MENIIKSLIDSLNDFLGPNLIVFIISTMPILELRGGLLAAKFLYINWKLALPICILGTLIPVPIILLFIKKIFEWLKHTNFVKFIDKFEQKIKRKSESVLKYETFGLFLFVAIPLPGTGAWTGAMIASLLDIPIKNSLLSIILGTLCAGIIMALLSYGVLGYFL